MDHVTETLNPETTRALLHDVPPVYHTEITEVLLTALVQAFSGWTGESCLLVDLKGHGREELFEDIDLSRTIGWFTSVYPVVLRLDDKATSPGNALKTVKEHLRAIPNRGIGFGLLRYLCEDAAIRSEVRQLPQAEVCFNYLGQLDNVLTGSALLTPAKESSGPARSYSDRRRHLLEINGTVSAGVLWVDWRYSKAVHHRRTIERLARGFLTALHTLIAHCLSPGV